MLVTFFLFHSIVGALLCKLQHMALANTDRINRIDGKISNDSHKELTFFLQAKYPVAI